MWPSDAESLTALQRELAERTPEPWLPEAGDLLVGGCWVCFPRGLVGRGSAADPAWAGAVVMRLDKLDVRGLDVRGLDVRGLDVRGRETVVTGPAGGPYVPGLLALRLGPLMEQATRNLTVRPDVLLLDATGRDHPRRAGLALHLGAVLDLPTVGVTHRPLLAAGDWPADRRGATSPLRIGDEVVGCWLRTRPGARPLAVHPGWRVDLDTAVALVAATARGRRTPEPLRRARHLARRARVATSPTSGR